MNERFRKNISLAAAGIVLTAALILMAAAGLQLRERVLWSERDLYPPLEDSFEIGEWYTVYPEGTVSANGSPWHGDIRIGSENNVIVYLFGGGLCFDSYMAARSYDEIGDDGFYFSTEDWILDYLVNQGIFRAGETDPFRNWSVIAIPYTTGDFHVGTKEIAYETLNGQPDVIRQVGYQNYTAMMNYARSLVGTPDKLLVTGTSAGGFATALLADDVISYFKETEDVTVCVDSALLFNDDWKTILEDWWGAPEEISERLTGNDITGDSLRALHDKYGERVKILYTSSVRDGEMARFQGYVDDKNYVSDEQTGDVFQKNLRESMEQIQQDIPECGIFIWDDIKFKDSGTLTKHTILASDRVYDTTASGISVAQWLADAVDGDVRSYGLDLMYRDYSEDDD